MWTLRQDGKRNESKLVLLNADFPRFKKNQLSKEQPTANEALAEKYNLEGKFPFTMLLTPAGIVVKTWEGLPEEDVLKFTSGIKKLHYSKNIDMSANVITLNVRWK